MSNTGLPPWDPPNTFEEFTTQYTAGPNNLFRQITALVQRIRHDRDTARTQLTSATQEIETLEEQCNQLSVDLSIARAGHRETASTSAAVEVPSHPPAFQSEKFPDPEKFNGTRAKLPGVITQLRMKLEVNDDRFRYEPAKVIYSISRLEGRALDQIVPLVNAKPSAPFSSIAAFIANLEASFGDPDPRGTALQELNELKQGSGDFASYYTKFLRIIAYLDYNESAKIHALSKGLADELKDAMAFKIDRPASLEELASTLMTIDNRIRGRRAEQGAACRATAQFALQATPHPSHVPGGLAPMDLSALQIKPASRPTPDHRYTIINGVRKITAAEKQWRRNNNLCMYCAGVGHAFNSCPTANRPRNQGPLTGALLASTPSSDTEAIPTMGPESGFQ